MIIKHTVNGDEFSGWYCYACDFYSRDVSEAAEHDGKREVVSNEETIYRTCAPETEDR